MRCEVNKCNPQGNICRGGGLNEKSLYSIEADDVRS